MGRGSAPIRHESAIRCNNRPGITLGTVSGNKLENPDDAKPTRTPGKPCSSHASRRKAARPTNSVRQSLESLEDRKLMANYSLDSLPILSSNSTASHTLYLDFNGDFQNNWWFRENGVVSSFSPGKTPAFDLDGDANTFNDAEIKMIKDIFKRVGEDYAPFDVNVTTKEPWQLAYGDSYANNQAVRVVVGGRCSDWRFPGEPDKSSGYAPIGGFTDDQPNVVYVFSRSIKDWSDGGFGDWEGRWNNMVDPTANTISHEAGHSFGLEHYYAGARADGSPIYDPGTSERTPIMGNNLTTDRATWHQGTNMQGVWQDDMRTLSKLLGQRRDDHGDWAYYATWLPTRTVGAGKPGVIGTTADVDWFFFESFGGRTTTSVAVPSRIGNLDAKVELWKGTDYGGILFVTSANRSDSLGATITRDLSPGYYYLKVSSNGQYGDVGQYTVSVGVRAALTVFNGRYVSAVGGGGGQVVADRYSTGAWETFQIIFLGTDADGREQVALQAFHGQFLCAEGGGGREVVANRDVIGEWETFTLIRLSNGQVAFQASNGMYLRADGGGGGALLANSPWIGGWEAFNLVML